MLIGRILRKLVFAAAVVEPSQVSLEKIRRYRATKKIPLGSGSSVD